MVQNWTNNIINNWIIKKYKIIKSAIWKSLLKWNLKIGLLKLKIEIRMILSIIIRVNPYFHFYESKLNTGHTNK